MARNVKYKKSSKQRAKELQNKRLKEEYRRYKKEFNLRKRRVLKIYKNKGSAFMSEADYKKLLEAKTVSFRAYKATKSELGGMRGFANELAQRQIYNDMTMQDAKNVRASIRETNIAASKWTLEEIRANPREVARQYNNWLKENYGASNPLTGDSWSDVISQDIFGSD